MNKKSTILIISLTAVLALGCGLIAACSLDASIVIVSFIILICSLFVLHRYSHVFNLRNLSIPGLCYIYFVLGFFIPAQFIFLSAPDPCRYDYIIAIDSVIITFPLGMALISFLFKYKASELKAYSSREVSKERFDARLEPAFLVCLVASIGFVMLYISEVKTLPLLYAISHQGSTLDIALLREESFKLLETRFIYIYEWLRTLVFPLLAGLSLGMYLTYKRKRWLLYFIVTFFMGTFYIALPFARGPVASFYLFLFLFFFLFQRGRFKIRYILLALIIVLSFPVLVDFLRTGKEFSISTLSAEVFSLGKRIFYSGAYQVYTYFTIFPEHHDFLWGQGIRPLAVLTGQDYLNVTNYVFRYLYPSRPESGFATVNFTGLYYVDFGMLGIFLSSFGLGALLQALQIWCLRRKKNLLNFLAYAWLVFACWRVGSITLLLWSGGVIMSLLFPWIMRLLGTLFTPERRHLALDDCTKSRNGKKLPPEFSPHGP